MTSNAELGLLAFHRPDAVSGDCEDDDGEDDHEDEEEAEDADQRFPSQPMVVTCHVVTPRARPTTTSVI